MVEQLPTKKKRRPRSELKEMMIQGGVEVLQELGVETQLSSVSYARVFEHIERSEGVRITYGSVHERIWNSLQEYQLSVIERAGVWNQTDGDGAADGWADWLQSAIALSSPDTDDPVAGATRAAAQATYAARTGATAPATEDPSSRMPAGADDDLLAVLSVAITDGLRLRSFLTGEPANPDDLAELGHAILSEWFRTR